MHLAWPEWWSGTDPDRTATTIEQVQRSGVKILWTQHNLLPHMDKSDAARACYQQWAAAADAVTIAEEAILAMPDGSVAKRSARALLAIVASVLRPSGIQPSQKSTTRCRVCGPVPPKCIGGWGCCIGFG